jgi:hypothetical protein
MNTRTNVRLHPDLMIALQRLAEIEGLPLDVLGHQLIGEAVVHRIARESQQPPRHRYRRGRRA